MGLNVYKFHLASRQYENTFFRMFQATLKSFFEQQGFDGVLVGFGDVPDGDSLYPDCVLITKNRVLIIDFKDWNNVTVNLPGADNFESGKWTTSNGKVVGGGSVNNANPYVQLKKQRRKLEQLVGGRLNEDAGGIGCLVVFQGEVKINGEIPGVDEPWFMIANKYSFGNAVYDMIDVRSDEKNDFEAMREEYFESEPYLDNVPLIDPSKYEEVAEANQKVEELESERDEYKSAYEEQLEKNKALREKGESIEEGLKLMREKEVRLKEKEEELEEAQADFEAKDKAYEKTMAEYDTAVEKTKQEMEKTKQAKLNNNTERQKALQEQAKAHAAELDYEKNLKTERRKSIFGGIFLMILFIGAIILLVDGITKMNRASEEKREEREQAEQALIEDKKAGKVCVGLDELVEYQNIKNVCVEYVAGDVAEWKTAIYLNHFENTDFTAIIWKNSGIITFEEAKERYANKKIRVRGTITYYEKRHYYEIQVDDLSQIEVLE
ncbi:NERD domain-containing protein [Candidatus Saccharibacteria bacterium]|nr:NERD domain-containing protein [Candidatus Saccharibacteria bacterium]